MRVNNKMNQNATFIYTYSAKENKEIQEIRNKYLPKEESKLEELKRLDSIVQNSGVVESLCAGIGGALVFGVGFCLTMKLFGSGAIFTGLGVLLGIVGMLGMFVAYPIYRKVFHKAKQIHAPRILELTEELTNYKK